MDPSVILRELCQRYGVSPAFGNKLRPLLERAQVVEPDAKLRIMDLIERSFAEEARRAAEERRQKQDKDSQDLRVLSAVAAILHDWEPPDWLKNWGPAQEKDPETE